MKQCYKCKLNYKKVYKWLNNNFCKECMEQEKQKCYEYDWNFLNEKN